MFRIYICILALFFCVPSLRAQQIEGMEYAFDTDPGPGNGTYVPLTPAATVDFVYNFNTSGLSLGVHKLILRFKDTSGYWGAAQYGVFFLTSGTNNFAQPVITAFDYYLDSVNSTHYTYDLPPNTQQFSDTAVLTFPGAVPGVHTLYLRTSSNNNLNGHYMARTIFLTDAPGNGQVSNITALEYMLDSGNVWTSVPVSPSATQIDDTLHLTFSSGQEGLHTLHTRIRNDADMTSHYQSRPFLIMEGSGSDSLTDMEVFFDTDPGFGNGLQLALNPAPSVDTTVTLTVPNGLSNANHIMYVRAKGNTGTWSHYQADTVKICTELPPVAGFDVAKDGDFISFNDTSLHGQNYFWDFGNGNTSSIRFPLEQYQVGTYIVHETVSNTCSVDSASDTVVIKGIRNYLPKQAAILSDSWVDIAGAGFDTSTNLQIYNGSITILPTRKVLRNSGLMSFYMDFHSATPGLYDVKITVGGMDTIIVNGFTLETKDSFDVTAFVKGPNRFRTNRWQTYSLEVENNSNYMVNGCIVNVFIPDNVETTIENWFINPFDSTYAALLSSNAAQYKDSLKWIADSVKYIELDTLEGMPYAGRLYKVMLPYIMPHGQISIPFRLRSTVNQNASLMASVFTNSMYGSPETPDYLSQIHDFGMLGMNFMPQLMSIGGPPGSLLGTALATFKDEFDAGTQAIFQILTDNQVTNERTWARLLNGDFSGAINSSFNPIVSTDAYKNIAINYASNKIISAATWGLGRVGSSGFNYIKPYVTNMKKWTKGMAEFGEGFVSKANDYLPDYLTLEKIKNSWGAQFLIDYFPDILKDHLANKAANELSGYISEWLSNRSDKPYNLSPRKSNIQSVASIDPNQITGPIGYGEEHYINKQDRIYYEIEFENLDTAQVPAQVVNIYDTLDAQFYDFSTFRFQHIAADTMWMSVVNDDKEFTVNIRNYKPGEHLRVNGWFDTMSGVIHWQFISLDTLTGDLLTDPDGGFLPPNVNYPEGVGSVSFSVALKETLGNMDSVSNTAYIYFDDNAPIQTNIWKNVLDLEGPQSMVSSVVQLSDTTVLINIDCADGGSGCNAKYIYIAAENDPYRPVTRILNNEKVGRLDPGYTYSFYSEAIDNVGNRESKAPVVEATITLQPTSIPEVTKGEAAFRCFPNPTTGMLNIDFSRTPSASLQVNIYDLTGKLMNTKALRNHSGKAYTLRLDDLSSGMYFVEILEDGVQSMGRQKIVLVQ